MVPGGCHRWHDALLAGARDCLQPKQLNAKSPLDSAVIFDPTTTWTPCRSTETIIAYDAICLQQCCLFSGFPKARRWQRSSPLRLSSWIRGPATTASEFIYLAPLKRWSSSILLPADYAATAEATDVPAVNTAASDPISG